MTIGEGNVSFGGVEMGATNATGIYWDRLTGLTDLPRLTSESAPPPRLHDPAVPGWADIGWRQITAENIHVTDDAKMLAVRGAMSNRRDRAELRFHDSLFSTDDLMVVAVADRCEFPRDAISHGQRAYQPSLQWLAADPTIYSAELLDLSFGGGGSPVEHVDLEVTNEGTFGTPSARYWPLLRIRAHGTVLAPYICVGPSVGNWTQVVMWHIALTSGQRIELDQDRITTQYEADGSLSEVNTDRNPARRPNGQARSGNSIFPDWPIIPPGDSVVRIGCQSGTVSGNFHVRRGAW